MKREKKKTKIRTRGPKREAGQKKNCRETAIRENWGGGESRNQKMGWMGRDGQTDGGGAAAAGVERAWDFGQARIETGNGQDNLARNTGRQAAAAAAMVVGR